MANTKLGTNVSPIISMEQQTSVFATSGTLDDESFTVPAGCHEIHCYPSAACHMRVNGTATTGAGSHVIGAGQMFVITHAQQATAEIIGASGALTLTVAYMK